MLHPFGDFITIGTYFVGLDDARFEEWDYRYSQYQRHHQVDGNRDGKVLQTVVEHTLHRDEERIENGTDADSGQEHGHKILAGRLYGGIKGLEAFAQILQIAINDHNRVIYYHSQHHNQCRQCHDVQFDTHHIHHCHTHKGAQRDGDSCHDGRTDGKQYHHHQDNDSHRNEQVAQEVAHALRHHLGLISYAGDIHVVGQFVLSEIFQYLIHLLTVLHHVITWRHLHRQ